MPTPRFIHKLTLLVALIISEYGYACNSIDSVLTDALHCTDSSEQMDRCLIIGSGRNAADVYTFLPQTELPRPNDITVDLPYECLTDRAKKDYTKPHIEAFATGTKGLFSIRKGIKELLCIDDPAELFDCIWFQRLGRGLLDLSQDKEKINPLVVGGYEALGYPHIAESPLLTTQIYLMNLASLLKPGGILLYQSFRCWTQAGALKMLYEKLLDLKRDMEAVTDKLIEKGEPAFEEISSLPSLETLNSLSSQDPHSQIVTSLKLVYIKLFNSNPPLFEEVVVDLIEERDWASTYEGKTKSWYGQLRAVRTTHKIPNKLKLN